MAGSRGGDGCGSSRARRRGLLQHRALKSGPQEPRTAPVSLPARGMLCCKQPTVACVLGTRGGLGARSTLRGVGCCACDWALHCRGLKPPCQQAARERSRESGPRDEDEDACMHVHTPAGCCSHAPAPLPAALTVSKDIRVRAEGLVKIMHMVCPRKGLKVWSLSASLFFASSPWSSIHFSSDVVKSSMWRKWVPWVGSVRARMCVRCLRGRPCTSTATPCTINTGAVGAAGPALAAPRVCSPHLERWAHARARVHGCARTHAASTLLPGLQLLLLLACWEQEPWPLGRSRRRSGCGEVSAATTTALVQRAHRAGACRG